MKTFFTTILSCALLTACGGPDPKAVDVHSDEYKAQRLKEELDGMKNAHRNLKPMSAEDFKASGKAARP